MARCLTCGGRGRVFIGYGRTVPCQRCNPVSREQRSGAATMMLSEAVANGSTNLGIPVRRCLSAGIRMEVIARAAGISVADVRKYANGQDSLFR